MSLFIYLSTAMNLRIAQFKASKQVTHDNPDFYGDEGVTADTC